MMMRIWYFILRWRFVLAGALLALTLPVWAVAASRGTRPPSTYGSSQLNPSIVTRDVPGSDGRWQEGSTVVPAPRAEVLHWLTDYGDWPTRFPDIQYSQVLGVDSYGRQVVRFRSRIVGRPITLRSAATREGVVFEGAGANVHTQGKIWVTELGPEQTQVIMQSTAEVHGLAGAFASQGFKRDRAFRKIRADLSALLNLAHAR
jgi:hypothetical protein